MFKNKVAVITGAASGIGAGIAWHCHFLGMKIVLADIEIEPLTKLELALQQEGADATAVLTDVRQPTALIDLAAKAYQTFHAVHYLFNNAGVGVGGAAWQPSPAHWSWIIDVNLKGVIHGIQAFVPKMMEQDERCMIINTSSIVGLETVGGMAPYTVTKHAVVALTKTMRDDLSGSNISVAVFCPDFVKTRIMDSYRNAPKPVRLIEAQREKAPIEIEIEQQMREMFAQAMPVSEAVVWLFKGILRGDFIIYTKPPDEIITDTAGV